MSITDSQVSDWWEQAKADLQVAQDNLSKHPFVTAQFSQQAVEKALKAYLLRLGKRIPRIHDLTLICEYVLAPARIKKIAEVLTPTYLVSRYPEVAQTIPARFYTQEQGKEFLQLAKEALQWIKEKLSQ